MFCDLSLSLEIVERSWPLMFLLCHRHLRFEGRSLRAFQLATDSHRGTTALNNTVPISKIINIIYSSIFYSIFYLSTFRVFSEFPRFSECPFLHFVVVLTLK